MSLIIRDTVIILKVIIVKVFSFSSVTQSCPTLCDPMDGSMPGLPVYHQLSEFRQTHVRWVGDVVPFSSCLQSFPISGSFQMSQFLTSGGQSLISIHTNYFFLSLCYKHYLKYGNQSCKNNIDRPDVLQSTRSQSRTQFSSWTMNSKRRV